MINQEVVELGVFSPEKQEGREDSYLKGAQRVPSWIKEAFQEIAQRARIKEHEGLFKNNTTQEMQFLALMIHWDSPWTKVFIFSVCS